MSPSTLTAAQQRLAELEKTAAPFREHVVEAAKYIGLDISSLENPQDDRDDDKKPFHGKEDWVLRWLLKKLQGEDGKSARLTSLSWRLLHHLIQTIPLPAVARVLNERKFMAILNQTLEDAKQPQASEATSPSGPDTSSKKGSRKRKRSGSFLTPINESSISELKEAVFATVSYLVAPPGISTSNSSQSALATAELVRSVIRTTAEEAARILGSWLSLCRNASPTQNDSKFLQPFIEIWESRRLGTDAMAEFSQHCTKQLLHLLLELSPSNHIPTIWKSQLEELLVRNVILPARASQELAENLIYAHMEAPLAPLILEISVHSIQSKSRSQKWLKETFAALTSSLKNADGSISRDALARMIRIAIENHLQPELSILRSIIVEYAFEELNSTTHWDLVAPVLQLNANVFLDQSNSDLLHQLLSRITMAAFRTDWDDVADQVVNNVTVPLLMEFSRDLSTFFRHWHAQMKEFVKYCNGRSINRFCAWEDDRLQAAFAEIMDTSLTTDQIIELIDWLDAQLKIDEEESVVAACVLLQAVADSIPVTNEKAIDDTRCRFSTMLSTENVAKNLSNPRYSWRKWCVVVTNVCSSPYPDRDAVIIWRTWSSELQKSFAPDNLETLYSYHAILCISHLWTAICRGFVEEARGDQEILAALLIKFLKAMDTVFTAFAANLKVMQSSREESQRLVSPDSGWFANAYADCMLIECHGILELLPCVESPKQNLLEKILRIASIPAIDDSSLWAKNAKCNRLPGIWKHSIKNDDVHNNRKVVSQLIEAMLRCTTMESTSDTGLPDCNLFVAECLCAIPLELFQGRHYKDRRVPILTAWAPNTVLRGYLNPVIWQLKMRILQHATFYDGMAFQDLVDMAVTLHHIRLKDPQPICKLIPLFGEIVKKTLTHVLTIADQTNGKDYLKDAVKFLKTESRKRKSFVDRTSPDKPVWDHIGIHLIGTVLQVFTGKAALHDQDILDEEQLSKRKASFKKVLISDLGILFDITEADHIRDREDHDAFLWCILSVLKSVETRKDDLEPFKDKAVSCLERIGKTGTNFSQRLKGFILVHPPMETDPSLIGDSTTGIGVNAIKELATKRLSKVQVEVETAIEEGEGADVTSKRLRIAQLSIASETAQSVLENSEEEYRLGKLVELGFVIAGCKDLRFTQELSDAYNILCKIVVEPRGIQEFDEASGIMSTILSRTRTKHQTSATSQHNIEHSIDSTLCAIACICSQNGPAIDPHRAGAIFSRLCDILQALLSNHRATIQGRFPLLLQATQALLRCLFTPLLHKSTKSTQWNPAPWLPSLRSQDSTLFPTPDHADQLARLVTLICDPSSTAVSRNQRNAMNLTSEKGKAKRHAGEHMIHLLTFYIRLQLDMKMGQDLHEKLRPAIWSIFDTTDLNARERVTHELDDKARPIWNRLCGDWFKNGKYKGN